MIHDLKTTSCVLDAADCLGAFAVLTKPVDPEELFDTIARAASHNRKPGSRENTG